MPLALVKITKLFEGEEWENVWCIGHGDLTDTGFTAADWEGYTGGGVPIAELTTNQATAPGTLLGGDSIIHSLLNFERNMHAQAVQFTRLFAWDGMENSTETSTFITVPLSFAGLNNFYEGDPKKIAPGNISWMVNKQPAEFGKRAGRTYFRLCLSDAAVRPGGKRLLDWTDGTIAGQHEANLQALINVASLDSFFAGAVNVGGSRLLIPHYVPNDPFVENGGSLISGSMISGLASQRPTSRQVQRGRKRKKEEA